MANSDRSLPESSLKPKLTWEPVQLASSKSLLIATIPRLLW